MVKVYTVDVSEISVLDDSRLTDLTSVFSSKAWCKKYIITNLLWSVQCTYELDSLPVDFSNSVESYINSLNLLGSVLHDFVPFYFKNGSNENHISLKLWGSHLYVLYFFGNELTYKELYRVTERTLNGMVLTM